MRQRISLGQVMALAVLTAGLLSAPAADAQTIKVHPLAAEPVLDGDGADWSQVKGTLVPLHPTKADSGISTRLVLIKGGVHADSVYFYAEWEDATRDDDHKPWVWESAEGKYVKGPQREDRLALQFAMDGDYTADWFSGQSFTADMWHWKAFRSNRLGLAHDKSTQVSMRKLLRSFRGAAPDGTPVYILRRSDTGDPIYVTKRYRAYVRDFMPKYVLSTPKGSIADVLAKGVWSAGKWYLELRRKLNTGHPDDVVFVPGGSVRGGVAVFDHSENDDHVFSKTLLFQF